MDNWDDLCDGLYDVVLVLRGLSVYEPKSIHYNVMWNISHPDEISFKEYESYDKLYIASEYWAEKIKPLVTVSTDSLIQCTDNKLFTPCYDEKYDTELLFVGNSRLVYRKILKDLLPTDYELRVYGTKWDGLIDEKYWVAEHIDNKDLYKAYSSTKVLLNDHWDDMREKGFISNRIFDAVACGTVVVTDHVRGIEDVFGDAVVYYDEPSQLDEKIAEALNKSSVDPSLVREHTFEARARKIVEDCNQYYDNLMKF
ncbi:MAG: hypothetical protein BZ136_04710 [Methanosphaera sp. rholeuAM74]|nr:MAG: hypothetical protein BZ136_04710 [Methanosphaera sp. rholeuAM74]